MQNEDETLQLIHSLTGPEIRFFKLYTRLSGGDKKFTALFDFFKNVKDFDEAEQSIQKNHELKSAFFNRKYLFGMILKSLRVFHSNKLNPDVIGIMDFDLLMRRGLFKSARKILQKNIGIKGSKDQNPYQLIWLMKESSMNIVTKNESFFNNYSSKLLEENLKTVDLQNQFYSLQFINHYLAALGRKLHFGTNPKVFTQLIELENKLASLNIDTNLNYDLYISYNNHKAAHALMLGRAREAFNYTQQVVNYFDKTKGLIQIHERNYSQVILHLHARKANLQSTTQSLDDMEKMFKKLIKHTTLPLSRDLELYIRSEYIQRKYNYLGILGESDKQEKFLNQHMQYIKEFKQQLTDTYFIWLNYSKALGHLVNNEFQKGYDELIKLFDKNIRLPNKLLLQVNLIELILHQLQYLYIHSINLCWLR